uniref:Ig-like domain-containing protein n=1 Tax=Fundulus heteroclitus TaxID=8078 RepID=A0A3Q2PYT3_FUNHE
MRFQPNNNKTKNNFYMGSNISFSVVFSPVFGQTWEATVVKTIDALVGSCVVLPCTFNHPGSQLPSSRLRGIWHRKDDKNEMFYHEDETKIQDSFKDRTKLLGHLGQKNCTLEILQVKDHDNGPFCFRIELVEKDDNKPNSDKFSFVEQCAEIRMLHDAPKPKLRPLKTIVQGKPSTVTCSIRHTCASHWPEITWSRGSKDEINEVHRDINGGIWETESILVFIPEEKDDHTDLTCTAKFHGGKSSISTFTLNVKRTDNYNHIIIPIVAIAVTALIFGLLCVLMVKKYK